MLMLYVIGSSAVMAGGLKLYYKVAEKKRNEEQEQMAFIKQLVEESKG